MFEDKFDERIKFKEDYVEIGLVEFNEELALELAGALDTWITTRKYIRRIKKIRELLSYPAKITQRIESERITYSIDQHGTYGEKVPWDLDTISRIVNTYQYQEAYILDNTLHLVWEFDAEEQE